MKSIEERIKRWSDIFGDRPGTGKEKLDSLLEQWPEEDMVLLHERIKGNITLFQAANGEPCTSQEEVDKKNRELVRRQRAWVNDTNAENPFPWLNYGLETLPAPPTAGWLRGEKKPRYTMDDAFVEAKAELEALSRTEPHFVYTPDEAPIPSRPTWFVRMARRLRRKNGTQSSVPSR